MLELNYARLERVIIPPEGEGPITISYMTVKSDEPYTDYEELEQWVVDMFGVNGWDMVHCCEHNPDMHV